MTYYSYAPCTELSPFVDKICIQESDAEPVLSKTHILPAGTVDILFHYGDPFLHFEGESAVTKPYAYIAGQRTRRISVAASGKTGIVIANLKPWGLSGFTRLSSSEFTEHFVDADALFPEDRLSVLIDALRQEQQPESRVSLVQDFLRGQLVANSDELVIAAVQSLYDQPNLKITCLASQFGISKRQLDRRFMMFTGLTPKKFQTIVRFQRSLGFLQQDLCTTAHEAGYFDQAHMNHDYQRLISSTPSHVLSRMAATPLMRFYSKPANMSRFYNHLHLQ